MVIVVPSFCVRVCADSWPMQSGIAVPPETWTFSVVPSPSANAPEPTVVSPVPTVTSFSILQYANAWSPIVATLGMLTLSRAWLFP